MGFSSRTALRTAIAFALSLFSIGCPDDFSGVDTTPPTVEALLVQHNGQHSEVFAEDYFVGDTLEFVFIASDDHEVRYLNWEVRPAGTHGTLEYRGQASVSPRVKLPVGANWVGPIELRLSVRDAAGLMSNVFVSPPDSLQVYATVQRPTNWRNLNGETRDLVIDVSRGLIYLLQANQSRIQVLSLATLQTMDTVHFAVPPTDIDLMPGGDSLLVTLLAQRALGFVDLRHAPRTVRVLPLRTLDTATHQLPLYARVAANGKVFVALEASAPAAQQLLELDLTTGSETLRLDAGESGYIGQGKLARSHDYSTLVLNGWSFQAYDAGQDAFGPRGSAGVIDVLPAVDAQGNVVAVGLALFGDALSYLRLARMPNSTAGGVPATAVSPNGEILYISCWSSIVRSRVSDGRIIDRTRNPIDAYLVRVSSDGAWLVTVQTSDASSSISVMDLR